MKLTKSAKEKLHRINSLQDERAKLERECNFIDQYANEAQEYPECKVDFISDEMVGLGLTVDWPIVSGFLLRYKESHVRKIDQIDKELEKLLC